tara:strand:- start:241 stop:786 length:546 start_codon:yes stop_codon:yes gene_type:complete
LELGDIQTEGVEEKFLTSGGVTIGGMVIQGYCGEVGVGKLIVGDVSTVDLELELISFTEDGEIGIRVRRGQVLHRVVEVHFLYLGLGCDRLLDLGHDHVLGGPREHLTLLGVQVRVVRVDIPLTATVRGDTTPCDTELDVMVLERDEREGGLPVLTERETKWVKSGVTETTSDRLRIGASR